MSSSAAPEKPKPSSPPEGRAVKHPPPPSPWAGEGQRSLLRPTTLALLFLAMGFVLVMLFPGENYNDPRYTNRADGVSVAYLRAILKVRPHDPEPRLVLAKQLLSLSVLGEAMEVLQPLLTPDRVTMLEAELLALEIDERRFYAAPEKSEARRAALVRVDARMERLLGARVSASALERVARISLSLGQPGRAAHIYLRLARFVRGKREEYLELAGRWFVAAGEYQAAARALRETALSRRDRPARAVATAIQAVDALVAGGRPREALALLEELRTVLGGGSQLLDRGLKLALSVSDLDRALVYAILRAASAPNDVKAQRQLRQLGLARQNMGEAFGAAGAVVRLRPNDPDERRWLAQVARWVGALPVSLENWVWLARRGDRPAIDEALTVARPLLEWDLIIEMLTLKGERGGLDPDALAELCRAYEAVANPHAAALAVKRWGDPEDRRTWELLAQLHDNAGRDAEEMEVLLEIERRFGRSLRDLMRQAELAYRLGQPDRVWTLLREARELAGPRDLDYWSRYADLAWTRDESDEALAAHRVLWAAEKMEPHEVGRFLLMLGRQGQHEEMLATVRQAWVKAPNPSYLLLAIQTAYEAQLYSEMESLMALADGRHALFKDLEHYWLLRAALMIWKNRPQEVEEAYRAALVVNPDSREARIGWLGHTLEQDQRGRLSQLLVTWWELALKDAAFARPYAAALDRLGRLPEALPFYDIEARARPRDLPWLESYADALSRAGHTDGARRLRGVVLDARRLTAEPILTTWSKASELTRPTARPPLARQPPAAAPVVAYARLLRQLHGAGAAAPVTQALLRSASFNREVQELAVESELERDNLAGVRRWMWRRPGERNRPRPPSACGWPSRWPRTITRPWPPSWPPRRTPCRSATASPPFDTWDVRPPHASWWPKG